MQYSLVNTHRRANDNIGITPIDHYKASVSGEFSSTFHLLKNNINGYMLVTGSYFESVESGDDIVDMLFVGTNQELAKELSDKVVLIDCGGDSYTEAKKLSELLHIVRTYTEAHSLDSLLEYIHTDPKLSVVELKDLGLVAKPEDSMQDDIEQAKVQLTDDINEIHKTLVVDTRRINTLSVMSTNLSEKIYNLELSVRSLEASNNELSMKLTKLIGDSGVVLSSTDNTVSAVADNAINVDGKIVGQSFSISDAHIYNLGDSVNVKLHTAINRKPSYNDIEALVAKVLSVYGMHQVETITIVMDTNTKLLKFELYSKSHIAEKEVD
jgi:hypothetical protein